MSKHDKKQEQHNTAVEQKPIEQPNNKKKDEIKELKEKLESLTLQLSESNKKNVLLESKINEINQDYVKKITEKAFQANKVIEEETKKISQKLTQEFENKTKYSLESIAIELIEVVNQFENALSHEPTDPKIKNYQQGFRMFLAMLKTILTNINVNEIHVKVNDEFDPKSMECFETQDIEGIKENHIVKVSKKGYKLHERVIVPALVVVCKKTN